MNCGANRCGERFNAPPPLPESRNILGPYVLRRTRPCRTRVINSHNLISVVLPEQDVCADLFAIFPMRCHIEELTCVASYWWEYYTERRSTYGTTLLFFVTTFAYSSCRRSRVTACDKSCRCWASKKRKTRALKKYLRPILTSPALLPCSRSVVALTGTGFTTTSGFRKEKVR